VLQLNTSKPATIALQLGGAWVVGALVLPTVWGVLVAALFAGSAGLLLGIAGISAVAVLAYLIVLVTATRAVSVLGAGAGRRVLWALLVLGGGTAGWALGWAATDVAGLGVSRSQPLTVLLGGVPFAVVAGLFLRGWRYSVTAAGLTVVLLAATVMVLRHESPGEFDNRLAAARVHRETAYAVAIPGYLPADRDYGNGFGGGSFQPRNPSAIPPDRYITIIAYDRLLPGEQMCGQPTAQDSRLIWGDCAVEPGGLVYRHNVIEHGYQVPVGQVYVTVVGTAAVEHDLLRAAALSLHLATDAELAGQAKQTGEYFAAHVPGYVGQVTGIPPGMQYAPADHTGSGGQSVSITLYVSYGGTDSICFGRTQCTPDGPGVTYIRMDDQHGYAVRHDQVEVQVMGGLRVDKALLRQAALDARPATDDELRRVVPPLKPFTPVDRLRHWLRQF
jgi:hypothetical protein